MRSKITKNGYIIDKKSIRQDELLKIRLELTVTPEIPSNFAKLAKPDPFRLYMESEKLISIPRFYGVSKFGNPNRNLLAENKYPKQKMKFNGSMRPNQVIIVNNVIKGLDSGYGGILVSGCGSGKTNMAIYIACKYRLKTLFIVHKEFLKNQIIDRIKTFTNCKKVGIIQQDKVNTEPAFAVGMIQSLTSRDYDRSVFSDFGMIIIDEVHHMGSRKFSSFFKKIAARYMLGISAESQRNDKLYKIINWYMGPILHHEEQKPNSMVVVKRYNFRTKNNKRTKLIFNHLTECYDKVAMVTNLIVIKYRNRLVANLIHIMHSHSKNILFLTDRRDHVDILYDLLEDNEYTRGHVGKYMGKMKQSDLDKSSIKQIILGTFSMAQEALDIPNLNVVILSTPKSNIKQSVGRILRKETYDEHPIVIDIVDADNSVFRKQSKRREQYYLSKSYAIQDYNVSDYDCDCDDNILWDDIEELERTILRSPEIYKPEPSYNRNSDIGFLEDSESDSESS